MIIKKLSHLHQIQATLSHEGKEYELICSHPYNILRDQNITWESKGCLSYLMLLENEIDLPITVIKNLIQAGYLIEVKE